jgi:hypothetical protein
MPAMQRAFALSLALSLPPAAGAFLEGGREDLAYVFDAVEARSEALYQVRKPQTSDSELRRQLFLTVLSDQPIGRDRRDPVLPRFLLSDVDLALWTSDGRDAKISVLETVLPQLVRQRIFRFSRGGRERPRDADRAARRLRGRPGRQVRDLRGEARRPDHPGRDLCRPE